jgi:hypothetical protein
MKTDDFKMGKADQMLAGYGIRTVVFYPCIIDAGQCAHLTNNYTVIRVSWINFYLWRNQIMATKKGSFTLITTVRLQETEEHRLPDVLPEAVVHAFDRNGELLATVAMPKSDDGYGQAKLKLPASLKGQSVRLVLGPPMQTVYDNVPPWMQKLLRESNGQSESKIPAGEAASAVDVERAANLNSLIRAGGYERSVRLAEEQQKADIVLQHPEWLKWLKCKCVVRGRLVRRIPLPNGTSRDLGICQACIKIYEVDAFPKLVARLPDNDIYRLRDELLSVSRVRIPEPPEELPPELEKRFPPPPPPPPETLSDVDFMPASELSAEIAMETRQLDSFLPAAMPRATTLASLDLAQPQHSSELQSVLSTSSVTALRDSMIANAGIIMNYICAVPWLAYWLRKDLIKCTCTDEQGRFETTIHYYCLGDKPDLYFKAVQCIGGTLHTLYDPGVICHTHWNYVCGTDVELRTHDPAARVCSTGDIYDPPPGTLPWIAPFGVGGTRLDLIKQPSGFKDYGSIVDAPFGSTLGFRHGYSSSIPNDDIHYYRWLYKKEGASQWREFADPVASTVIRHFVDEDLANPLDPPTFPAYLLGPHSINGMHLYEFKPHEPPELTGHKRYWPPDDWFHEIYTGILRSHILPGGVDDAAGKYKIKLEIYDPSGSKVPHNGTKFRFIVPTGLASDEVTIETRDADSGEVDSDGFVFYLHIDNRKCSAYIDGPTIGSTTADDDCGFLRYNPGDNVRIAYRAKHPGNHAFHSFWIRRGIRYVSFISGKDVTDNPVTSLVFSDIVDAHNYNNIDGDGYFVRSNFPSADLLGTCSDAAFAEISRVYAKATNGWTRLNQYDARFERAFALAKKSSS